MGDVAMTVPVVRAFVSQYPQHKITVVSRPFFKPFFDAIPNVTFCSIDVTKKHKGFIGLFRLFLELRKLKIDFIVDLHNVLRSKIIRAFFFFTNTKIAATDKGRAEKKALTRIQNKIFKPLTPIIKRHQMTFEKLGFPIDLSEPIFPKKAILNPNIEAISSIKTQKWIGIAPFAQYQSKVYPLDLMQNVIAELAQLNDVKLFLFGGGKKEIDILEQFQKEHKNVVNCAGKLKFNEELDLISNLDVMLSMDSGNAHIAAMLGISVVTLWGATHPFAGFQPFHQPDDNCLTVDRTKFPNIPTSIYGNKVIPGYENAMQTIEVEKIVAKLKSIISV